MLATKTLTSSIGKKMLMALSGLALLGFVLGHLIGNLLIFKGADSLNAYAAKLVSLGPLLWVMRIGLLAMVGTHIVTAILLTLENREARPIGYMKKATIETTYAARTMMLSGLIVLAFILFHLLHFTFKVTHPEISHSVDALGHHDVYSMVVLSFQDLWISSAYIVAIFLLCMHLSHGIASIFQSLGFNSEKCIGRAKWIGRILACLLFLGYISIPLSVLAGVITPAGGAS